MKIHANRSCRRITSVMARREHAGGGEKKSGKGGAAGP
jgi:hypothetical protein